MPAVEDHTGGKLTPMTVDPKRLGNKFIGKAEDAGGPIICFWVTLSAAAVGMYNIPSATSLKKNLILHQLPGCFTIISWSVQRYGPQASTCDVLGVSLRLFCPCFQPEQGQESSHTHTEGVNLKRTETGPLRHRKETCRARIRADRLRR